VENFTNGGIFLTNGSISNHERPQRIDGRPCQNHEQRRQIDEQSLQNDERRGQIHEQTAQIDDFWVKLTNGVEFSTNRPVSGAISKKPEILCFTRQPAVRRHHPAPAARRADFIHHRPAAHHPVCRRRRMALHRGHQRRHPQRILPARQPAVSRLKN